MTMINKLWLAACDQQCQWLAEEEAAGVWSCWLGVPWSRGWANRQTRMGGCWSRLPALLCGGWATKRRLITKTTNSSAAGSRYVLNTFTPGTKSKTRRFFSENQLAAWCFLWFAWKFGVSRVGVKLASQWCPLNSNVFFGWFLRGFWIMTENVLEFCSNCAGFLNLLIWITQVWLQFGWSLKVKSRLHIGCGVFGLPRVHSEVWQS